MKRTPIILLALLASCTTQKDNIVLLSSLQAPYVQKFETVELPKSRYERGIEIIASDDEWRKLHDFLHRVTSQDSRIKIELSAHQNRYLADFEKFQPFRKKEEEMLLRRVLSVAHSELALADLVFLSEVHQSLHTYINGAQSPPRPQYELKTDIQIRYPRSTNISEKLP